MSDKIRWGVLSTARHARANMPNIQKTCNGTVQAVASRDLPKAQAFARQFDIPKAYGRYEDLLADPEIDAVYVPLPVALHAEWTIRSAEAGKSVLCEKPLAANAEEGRKIAETARRCKVPIMEGLMYRYHPLTMKVEEMLSAGAVGKVHLVRTSFTGMPAAMEGNIRFRKDLAGGALRDVGCYCISMIRLAVGEEPKEVRSLALFGRDHEVDEMMAGVLRFPGGALGYFGCSLVSSFDCSYDIVGDKGRILVDRGGMVLWPNEDFKIKHWSGDNYQEIVIPNANHVTFMFEDFSEAVLRRRPPRITLEESIHNLEVTDRLLRSVE